MGRLSVFIFLTVILFSTKTFATTEKDNESNIELLRLQTLAKEKEKEEKTLHILTEKLTFCIASEECSSQTITEIKENILACEDNIKFLTVEIQNAKGKKPQATSGKQNVSAVPQKENHVWWDVYSREKTVK